MEYSEINKDFILKKLNISNKNDTKFVDFLLEIYYELMCGHKVYLIKDKKKSYILYDK
jgi:predicted choloylglycine hydrolase